MNRSHAARWTALSVIAPVTAGVFAGSIVWAVNNDPREATAPVSAEVATPVAEQAEVLVASGVDPVAAEELRRLTERIAEVRTQTEKVLEQAASIQTDSAQTQSPQPAPAAQPAQPQPVKPAQPQPAKPAQPQPAKPAPQPAPQPAPPADTTTGAS